MANEKEKFLESLNETPEGIQAFLETELPDAPTISTPTTVDDAIIASGVLSKYLLDLFGTFAGLTPIELMLRIGQHVDAIQIAAMVGYKFKDKGGEHEIGLESPIPGQPYAAGQSHLARIYITGDLTGIEAVQMSISGPNDSTTSAMQDSITFDETDYNAADEFYSTWSRNNPGTYTFSFSATIDGFTVTSTPFDIEVT